MKPKRSQKLCLHLFAECLTTFRNGLGGAQIGSVLRLSAFCLGLGLCLSWRFHSAFCFRPSEPKSQEPSRTSQQPAASTNDFRTTDKARQPAPCLKTTSPTFPYGRLPELDEEATKLCPQRHYLKSSGFCFRPVRIHFIGQAVYP